jgi:hypothetical protein
VSVAEKAGREPVRLEAQGLEPLGYRWRGIRRPLVWWILNQTAMRAYATAPSYPKPAHDGRAALRLGVAYESDRKAGVLPLRFSG